MNTVSLDALEQFKDGLEKSPIRPPWEHPPRFGAPTLVFLDVINAWDIGWHDTLLWHSRSYGLQYPVIFWMNLPVEPWVEQCLTLASSTDRLAAISRCIADASVEKSRRRPSPIIREALRAIETSATPGLKELKLPLFESRARRVRRGSRQTLHQLPFGSYLHVLYGEGSSATNNPPKSRKTIKKETA